jgi:hypothetical protein
MKQKVMKVAKLLEKNGFQTQAIPWARVPVIKAIDRNSNNPHSADGKFHYDLCFNNDIAVLNSRLLREYSVYDARVRQLMFLVKSWVKRCSIGSAADGTFSSYTWINLVIYYCQRARLVPNLQCPQLLRETASERTEQVKEHLGLDVDFVTAKFAKQSLQKVLKQQIQQQQALEVCASTLGELLRGFFAFYASEFDWSHATVSIKAAPTFAAAAGAASRREEDDADATTAAGSEDASRNACGAGSSSSSKQQQQQQRKKHLEKKNGPGKPKIWRLMIEDPFETFDSKKPHDLGYEEKKEPAASYLTLFYFLCARFLGRESKQSSSEPH